MRRSTLVKVIVTALSLILCGCGGSSSSSSPPSIAGTWQVTAALEVGEHIIATVTLSPGVITQTGTSFESATGSEMDFPENTSPLCGTAATIASGSISGNTVTFTFVLTGSGVQQVLMFTGTVSGPNPVFMSGTYTVPAGVPGNGCYPDGGTGQWSAAKQ